jgi:hypothetical protein
MRWRFSQGTLARSVPVAAGFSLRSVVAGFSLRLVASLLIKKRGRTLKGAATSPERNSHAECRRHSAEAWVGLALSPLFKVFPRLELEDLAARSGVRVPTIKPLP